MCELFELRMIGMFIGILSSAKILLHDPHMETQKQQCASVRKVFEGAHGVLNQLYAIWTTSYDLTLLDNFCSVSVSSF